MRGIASGTDYCRGLCVSDGKAKEEIKAEQRFKKSTLWKR